VYPDRGKVFVEGINIATKHRRVQRTRQGAQEGGIVHEEVPVDLSNVMPICPTCKTPTRVGARDVAGKKVRHCRRCDSEF
jgi:large subunit ribosomal protein L24